MGSFEHTHNQRANCGSGDAIKIQEYENRIVKERQRAEEAYNKLLEERNNFSKTLLDATGEMSKENRELREGYMRLSETMKKNICLIIIWKLMQKYQNF